MDHPYLVDGVHHYSGSAGSQWNIRFANQSLLTVYAEKDADVRIGEHVRISPNTQFGMPGKPLKKLVIGNGTTIYGGMIAPDKFVCGDFVTIHKDVFIYGKSHCVIGHNSWFGMRCTLDCEGEWWQVGNNFGAGQDTHMWSHIAHGDVLRGCGYHDLSRGFSASDDVWLVGRCTSAPVHHDEFSVALTESNLVKGMGRNQVWGGNPAKDLTDKIGHPYDPIAFGNLSDYDRGADTIRKSMLWANACNEYAAQHGPIDPAIKARFDITEQTYEPDMRNPALVEFFLYLLKKKKFKFVPVNRRKVELNNA